MIGANSKVKGLFEIVLRKIAFKVKKEKKNNFLTKPLFLNSFQKYVLAISRVKK
jgi:hypothetical protein